MDFGATSCTSNEEDTSGEAEDTNYSSDEGVDVKGGLFFDPLDDPLNESDDESSVGNQQYNNASSSEECDNDWVPFDEPPMESNNDDSTIPSTNNLQEGRVLPSQIDENKQQSSLDVDASPQILEELPLPRMFIPGQIVHIYTHEVATRQVSSWSTTQSFHNDDCLH